MEIKGVINEERKEYPKINDINKKCLKKNIPSKWAKCGILSFLLSMNFMNSVFAKTSINEVIEKFEKSEGYVTAGITTVRTPVEVFFYDISPIISAIVIVLTGALILRAKIKAKKKKETSKVKRWILIVFFLSIIYLIPILFFKFYNGYL